MVAVSGNGWRLAPCLKALIDQADDLFPNRSTISDGSIGDTAHAARASDHNPADGWVCAVDVTDDKANGCDADLLARHIVASRDPRVKYVIWNRTIAKSYPSNGIAAWTPQPYTGINAHEKHTHVSVHNTATARDNTSGWWPQQEDDMPSIEDVEALLDRKLDEHRKWVRAELGTVKEGEPAAYSLYAKVRKNADTLRDSLADLIRGDG